MSDPPAGPSPLDRIDDSVDPSAATAASPVRIQPLRIDLDTWAEALLYQTAFVLLVLGAFTLYDGWGDAPRGLPKIPAQLWKGGILFLAGALVALLRFGIDQHYLLDPAAGRLERYSRFFRFVRVRTLLTRDEADCVTVDCTPRSKRGDRRISATWHVYTVYLWRRGGGRIRLSDGYVDDPVAANRRGEWIAQGLGVPFRPGEFKVVYRRDGATGRVERIPSGAEWFNWSRMAPETGRFLLILAAAVLLLAAAMLLPFRR